MSELEFSKSFDFEQYLNSQLLGISDEGQRRVMKDVVRDTMLPLYDRTINAYEELEHRLSAPNNNSKEYKVVIGLSNKSSVDMTEESLIPMDINDMSSTMIEMNYVLDEISKGNSVKVMTVYIDGTYDDIQKINLKKRTFNGRVHTVNGEYHATFEWKQNSFYKKKLEDLYYVYEKNCIDWQTVCSLYLDKFFDVYILETDCPSEETVETITIDFEEWDSKIEYNKLPMWNVRFFKEKTSAYPSIANDHVHYEHIIYKERLNLSRDYLVVSDETNIWEVFTQNGDIHIICDAEEPVIYQMIEFGYDSLSKRYEYPVYYNKSERKNMTKCVRTVGTLKRFVNDLGYKEMMTISGINHETEYRMNNSSVVSDDVISDLAFRKSKKREYLILYFELSDKNNKFAKDIMKFLVDCVQWLIPEYICVGEFK